MKKLALILALFAFALVMAFGANASEQRQTLTVPEGGTTLTFYDETWRCSAPLDSYAVNGLPLTVIADFSGPYVPANGSAPVQLGQGCVGPGQDGVLDLDIIVRGNGLTFGPGSDAVRFMNATPGVSNMDVRIDADCGPRVGDAHLDGLQVLGGSNVTVWNSRIGGNYDAGKPTCMGAGGAFFYSLPSNDIDIVGGKFIGCNHALNGQNNPDQTRNADIDGASFRSGYAPGDAVCGSYNISPACVGFPASQMTNVVCDEYPWDTDPTPPPPSPPPPSPPPPSPPPPPPPPPYAPACEPTCDEQIAALVATVAARDATIAQLQSDNAALAAQVSQLQTQVAQLQAQVADLLAQVNALGAKIAQWEEWYAAAPRG